MKGTTMATKPQEEINRAAMEVLGDILDYIREDLGDVSIDELKAFIQVYKTPQRSQKQLRETLGFSTASLGRYLQVLGADGFRSRPGLELLFSEVSPTHWREREYSVTPKGRAVVSNIVRLFRKYATRESRILAS